MDTNTDYWSHEEIFRQADSLGRTLSHVLSRRRELEQFWADGAFTEICFVACGSSYWLSVSAAQAARESCAIPASARTSGDVVMHPRVNTPVTSSPLYVAPSRSGKTTETLEALSKLRAARPGRLLSITGDKDSPLTAISDVNISVDWAVEKSICQTRSFSNLYLAVMAVIGIWASDDDLLGQLESFVSWVAGVLETLEPRIETLSGCKKLSGSLFVLGSGVPYGAACEGAYILIEMAQASAFYYRTLELRHGPMVVVDSNSAVFLLSSRHAREYERRVILEARAKGACVIVVCDNGNFPEADTTFSIGREYRDEVTALFFSVIMQATAYYLALARGANPDSPDGLVPWIDLHA